MNDLVFDDINMSVNCRISKKMNIYISLIHKMRIMP